MLFMYDPYIAQISDTIILEVEINISLLMPLISLTNSMRQLLMPHLDHAH